MDLRSGFPFSLIKNGLVAEYPKLETDIRTEVVILGGGISGALSAYYLIKRGIPCIILDARTIGLGSTCASTSLLQYEIDTPLFRLQEMIGKKEAITAYRSSKEAIDKLIQVAAAIGFKGIEKRKSLYYAAAKKDVNDLEKEFACRKEAGFGVRFLTPAEIEDEAGLTAPAAILSADAAQTDAYLFTHHLHQYGIKKGLKVFDRSPVLYIRHNAKSVELKTGNGQTIRAQKLIYATGYESVNYIDKNILKLESTYATVSEPMTEDVTWKDRLLLWNTADPYLYMRTVPGNRIIIGGRDEAFYSPSRRDKLLRTKTKQLANDFSRAFPELSFIPEFSWTGTFGSTKDGLPFIGKYDKLPNSYFALGFGGNGITFSQLAAEIIAADISGHAIKKNETRLYSFDRI